ncbi:hypothetical protein [Adhaeribacter aquaticus]|uniref:hypothetical protein n=1 Tax=Adhaeribacter aquaticus TaxID=299567 RepID=UPI000416D038|nr:hypothetical protein [Adhaeribacter aquaticus]
MDLVSSSNNIQHTAQLILDAFRHFGTQANEVLSYDELLPFLEKQSEHPQHYKDSLKEAEYHLSKEAYATPDVTGLRLTEVGYGAIQQGKEA